MNVRRRAEILGSRKREQEKVSGTFSRYEATLRTNGRLQKKVPDTFSV